MFTIVNRLVPVIALAGLMLPPAQVLAQTYDGVPMNNNYNAVPSTPSYNYQQGRVSYVPAGLMFPVRLQTSISTDAATPGDTVQAALANSINLGSACIPAGTTIIGNVTDAKAGGFLGRSGMVTIKFNRMRLPNGAEVPMSAHIVGDIGKYALTANQSDTIKGETWKNKVGQAALRGTVGAGAGAALGTAIGAIAGSHGTRGRAIGRGAWSGAAIGGGVGLADSLLLRKGKNVVISSGQQLQLQLDSPVTLSQSVQTGTF